MIPQQNDLIYNLVIRNEKDLNNLPKAIQVSFDLLFEDQKYILEQFFLSENMDNIKYLDLSNLDITDNDIKILSENQSLQQLININISSNIGNNKITIKSLKFILESPYIGSKLDYPQKFQGKYVSNINIDVRGRSDFTFKNIKDASERGSTIKNLKKNCKCIEQK